MRKLRKSSLDAANPLVDILSDSIAILLQHTEMAIAKQADCFEQNKRHVHSRLSQVFD